MDCKDSVQWISDWLDGALTPIEERMLMMHLEQCPECAALWEQLTALHTTCSDLPEIPAPEGFAQGVMSRVREMERTAPTSQPQEKVVPFFGKAQIRRWMAVAACFVLGFGLSRADLLGEFGAAAPDTAAGAVAMEAAQNAPMELERAVAPSQAMLMQEEAAQPESVREADCQEMPAEVICVLTLEKLPEGSEEVLGEEIFWSQEEGGKSCMITGEQVRQLLKLAEEQGLSIDVPKEEIQEQAVWELRVAEK